MLGKSELYPIGTNLYYLASMEHGTYTNTGEFIADSKKPSGGTYDYVPIDPTYQYEKTMRIYCLYFFDNEKRFLSRDVRYNNPNTMLLTNIPSNAAYIRWSFVYNNQWQKSNRLTRIA